MMKEQVRGPALERITLRIAPQPARRRRRKVTVHRTHVPTGREEIIYFCVTGIPIFKVMPT